jgi:pimeloyl-ACP methyl ester carboxylesterase
MPPVLLLHGWGGSFKSTWARAGWQAALEARSRDVFEIDLPGHGRPASHDPADYVDLAGTLDSRLPKYELDVVAYSLGAKLALALASRSSGRFRRIALGGVGDNIFAPEPGSSALVDALMNGVDANTLPVIADLVRYAAAGGGELTALAAVLRRPPNPVVIERDLVRVENVLLVNGANDNIALPDTRLRRLLRTAAYLSLPGIDHLSLPSNLAFREAALDFLDDV